MSNDLLLTIDGHSMAFRAFYALPPEMVAKDGTPTNAIYGFCSMLSNVIAQYHPTHIVVAFDTSADTYRVELDDQYKAQRDETPELFVPQVDIIIEMLDVMGITVCMQDGFEADDIIATYASMARDKKIQSINVTGDRDYFQLVQDPYINVMYVKRGVSDTVVYDEAGIIERTGVRPDQYVDYAAMRGDTSDNLPGVSGVGEKTAAKLLNQYEDLEGIYENLDSMTPKARANLEEGKERAFLNREIMTLIRDVKDIPSLKELKRVPGYAKEITQLCERLQFRAMAKKLLVAALVDETKSQSSSKSTRSKQSKNTSNDNDTDITQVVINPIDIEQSHKLLETSEEISLYLKPITPSSHVDNSIKFPFDILFDFDRSFNKLSISNKTQLKKVLLSLQKNSEKIICYNSKSYGSYFAFCNMDLIECNDIAVMALLDDTARSQKSYEQLCATYLGIAIDSTQGQLGLDLDGTEDESADDISKVFYIKDLYDEIKDRLESKNLVELYETLERPLTPVVSIIETNGVYIDKKKLSEISKDVHQRCEKYQQEIHSYSSEPFNVNSTVQLRKVLFDELGLTPIKKTKTGPSTDAQTLMALIDEHPIIDAILRYREVEKLRSTYVDALEPLISNDGRIHATFNQLGSATGRMSSEAPNLQNIPTRTDEGRKLRTMFIAPKDSMLVSIDYSQIELRILAHLSKEKTLVDAFRDGQDIHSSTASKVFDVDLDKVTKQQRDFAKVVNFGIAYGMESYGLATRMGIDNSQAKEILDSYWSSFSLMKKYLDSVVRDAKKIGYTQTMFGRRRYFPELSSSIGRLRVAGERAATNAPVQGSAADIFKLAMVKVQESINSQSLPAKMVLTVHDELVFEIPSQKVKEVSLILKEVMENVVELDVPLIAEVGIGPNWAEAK